MNNKIDNEEPVVNNGSGYSHHKWCQPLVTITANKKASGQQWLMMATNDPTVNGQSWCWESS